MALSPYQKEELENIRRAAENGRKSAERLLFGDWNYVDLFQHIIDTVERIKKYERTY